MVLQYLNKIHRLISLLPRAEYYITWKVLSKIDLCFTFCNTVSTDHLQRVFENHKEGFRLYNALSRILRLFFEALQHINNPTTTGQKAFTENLSE